MNFILLLLVIGMVSAKPTDRKLSINNFNISDYVNILKKNGNEIQKILVQFKLTSSFVSSSDAITEWFLGKITEAIQDSNTDPALVPLLENILNEIMNDVMNERPIIINNTLETQIKIIKYISQGSLSENNENRPPYPPVPPKPSSPLSNEPNYYDFDKSQESHQNSIVRSIDNEEDDVTNNDDFITVVEHPENPIDIILNSTLH